MNDLVETIRVEMEGKSSDELISILRNQDENEWRPEAFEAAALVLESRGIARDEVRAMGPEGVDVLESQPTVTIAKYFAPAEAHASRMALEEAGIPAWVIDEAGGTLYSVGIGTRLQVRAKDEDAARAFLSTATNPAAVLPPGIAEPPCPSCGSRNVLPEARITEPSDPAWARNRRTWVYACRDCDHAWPMDDVGSDRG